MDPFTHAIIPYLLFRAARADKNRRFAALVGGISPDLDVLFSFIPMVAPGWYIMSHRGVFHSFAFMWIMVLLAFFLFTREHVKKWIKRVMKYDVELTISPKLFIVGYIGAVFHVALDWLTMDGPALFFPLTEKRFSVNLFPYGSDIILIPFGVMVILFSTRRPWPKMKPAFAGFVVLFLLLSCTRIAFRTNTPPDGELYPASTMNQWIIVEYGEGSIKTTVYDSLSGKVVMNKTFSDYRSNASVSAVLARSDSMPEVRWWLWGNSVVSVSVEYDELNKTWLVHYTSVIDDVNYHLTGGVYFWYGSDFTLTVEVAEV